MNEGDNIMDVQFEEEKPEKSRKGLKIIIFFLAVAAFLYGFAYLTWSTGMGRIIDSKNSDAATYMKAVRLYAEEYSKTNGKLPADKDYIVKGHGYIMEPCELFPDGADLSYITSETKTYWAVRFRDGEPPESWAIMNRPLKDEEIVHFTRDDQAELYRSDIMHADRNVVGHCCGIEPMKYFH